jgi:cellulose synthase/poly-beta-1,6-N-acetylglucosamine synthase-like glycosyltransferase
LLITFYIFYWVRHKEFISKQKSFSTKVSVLVAVRNEENAIPVLASCLKNQNFPGELVEIIFVNDNSTDRTEEVIRNSFLHSEIKYRVINLVENECGKKTAIAKGVANAKGNLIVTTDADCIMGANWLSTIVSFYEQNKPVMIVMPVLIKAKTFFADMQAMEFLSLTASTASSLLSGFPLMCNGANLAFEKDVFGNAYSSNNNIPTGDDTFLMFYLHHKFKDRVAYLKSKDVVVKTKAENTFKSFLHQRIRWTSKVRHYNKLYIVLAGILIFAIGLVQISGVFCLTQMGTKTKIIYTLVILFLPKALIDFVYLRKVSDYFSEKFSYPVFIMWQIIYPLYVVLISVLSPLLKYEWKGRKV